MKVSLVVNVESESTNTFYNETLLALLRRHAYFGVKHGCKDGKPINSYVMPTARL